MKLHYIWNVLISIITTVLIINYDFPIWIWLVTFMFSVFEYKKPNDNPTKL